MTSTAPAAPAFQYIVVLRPGSVSGKNPDANVHAVSRPPNTHDRSARTATPARRRERGARTARVGGGHGPGWGPRSSGPPPPLSPVMASGIETTPR